MNSVTVVVLARYADIFSDFLEGIDKYEPEVRKILIKDGDNVFPSLGDKWTIVQGPAVFSYAHNVTLGWRSAGNDDVLLCGDDTRFTAPFISELQRVAYSDPTIGICGPELNGHSPFCCGLFKRSAIDLVGPMDERYEGYGKDDNDWCHRMGLAGLRTQPVNNLGVIHSSGGTTFYRREREGGISVAKSCEENDRRFQEKWGKEPVTGDGRWLKQ